LGLIAIACYDAFWKISATKTSLPARYLHIWTALALIVLIGLFAETVNADYGLFGVGIIALFFIFRNHKVLMAISFIVAVILNFAESIIRFHTNGFYGLDNRALVLCIGTILPIIFILAYNNKKGRNLKQILYWFYPIHLLIIYGVSLIF